MSEIKLNERYKEMKYNHKTEPSIICGARFLLAVAVPFWGMSFVSGCEPATGSEAGVFARTNSRSVEVTQVPVRHCSWDPLGRTGEDVAMRLVKTLIAGDVGGVDEILSRGKIGINDVICLTENDNVRRGKLYTDQTQFRPPEIARNVGSMYARFLNAYTVTDKYDSALGKNEVIEFYGTPLMMAARAGNPTMVSFLLKQGANPNIFVKTKGVDVQMEGQAIGGALLVSGRRPWAVLCALTECYVRTAGKYVENEDECAAILIQHGAVMPPKNQMGQTALWAVAQARSRFLLDQFVKMGVDVNHDDDLGMTVADYVSREIGSLPIGNERQEYEAFLGALEAKGACVSGRKAQYPTAENIGGRQMEQRTSPPAVVTPRQDHSAEIAAIEAQLKGLRMQLVDAKHDANMNAISGTAELTAQMRVMSLIDAIHERERKLAALQEASR